jgi:hypothetical protein
MQAWAKHGVLRDVTGWSHLMWLMMRFVGGMKKSSTPAKGVRMRCWLWPVLASVITYNTEWCPCEDPSRKGHGNLERDTHMLRCRLSRETAWERDGG